MQFFSFILLNGVQSYPWLFVKTLQNHTYNKLSIRFEQVLQLFVALTEAFEGQCVYLPASSTFFSRKWKALYTIPLVNQ